MIVISELREDFDFMYLTMKQAAEMVGKPLAPQVARNYEVIKAILENFWIEGEPGHEEYHIHPKAFGDEEDVRT